MKYVALPLLYFPYQALVNAINEGVEDDEEGVELSEGRESEGRGRVKLFEKESDEMKVLRDDEGEEEVTINIYISS